MAKDYIDDVTNTLENDENCTVILDPIYCDPVDYASVLPVHNHDSLYYRKDYIDQLFQTIALSTPLTYRQVNLTTEEEVVITWSEYISKHGTRPVYIDLYELTGTGSVQSTARVYTEDDGLTYRWFVGANSSRNWEVRIYGNTNLPLPSSPSNLGFNYYTFDFPFT